MPPFPVNVNNYIEEGHRSILIENLNREVGHRSILIEKKDIGQS